MSKLRRRRVITAKIEGTYGVDAVPVGTDAVQIEELSWAPEGLRMVERPAIRNSLGALQHVYGGSLLQVSFTCEVKGSGAAGTAPELGTLFRGSAHGEVIDPGVSVIYAPVSAVQESLTIYVYEDGLLTKLLGCRGTCDFTGEAGARLMAAFTFTGHFSGPTDVALVTPTYDSTVPPILIAGNLDLAGYGPIVQAFNFTPGLTVEIPPDLNAADGYSEVLITGRDVNGSINPEQVPVATQDFMADFKAGTTVALDSGAFGAAGNIFQITMPALYYRGLNPGEREGVLMYDLPFGAAEVSGDDEYSLAFT